MSMPASVGSREDDLVAGFGQAEEGVEHRIALTAGDQPRRSRID
ncbi:MAG: hypothetical protein ACRD0K_20015 [Egibacteraceae bacterium]